MIVAPTPILKISASFQRIASDCTAVTLKAGAARFEHSSSNRTPIIGLDAALGLFECIDGGMQAVESRILGLTAHTIAGLERLGYPVVSPQGHGERSGIVCFKSHVEGQQRTTIKALPAAHQPPSPLQSAQQIVDELALHNIYLAARGDVVRISPHFYNTLEEIDTLLNALEEMKMPVLH